MHLNGSMDSQADVFASTPKFRTPERRPTDRSHLLASPVVGPRLWTTEDTSHFMNIPNVNFRPSGKSPIVGQRRSRRSLKFTEQASWSPLPERSSYSSVFAATLQREGGLDIRKETARFKRVFKKVKTITQRTRSRLPRSFRVFSKALDAFHSILAQSLLRPTGFLRWRRPRRPATKFKRAGPLLGRDSFDWKQLPLQTLRQSAGFSPLCGSRSPVARSRANLLHSPRVQFSLLNTIQEVKPQAARLNSETGLPSDKHSPDMFVFWRDASPQEKRAGVNSVCADDSSESESF